MPKIPLYMETPFKTKGGRSLFLDKLLLVRTGLKYIYLEYRFFTVSRMVHWYKAHREVLDGDIIHLRRADGRDLDYWLSVNPGGEEKGMLVIYNPTGKEVVKTINVPLYYTGLTDKADISTAGGTSKEYTLDREYAVKIEVSVKANSYTWMVIKIKVSV